MSVLFLRSTPNADSRGKLHPHVKEVDLHNLFNGGDTIVNIAIRTTRGCGVIPIPEEAMVPSDRCYASVAFNDYDAYCRALEMDDPQNPPILRGLPVLIKLSAADMPEVPEILKRTIGLLPRPGTKTKYVKVIRLFVRVFADDRFRRTKKQTGKSKRIAVQKTEIIEDQPSPPAGPSKKRALQKAR